MEALKRSFVYIFAAGLYFYHLGAWTYRVEGFTLAEATMYPEIAHVTYAYLVVILAFIISGIISAVGNPRSVVLIFVLLAAPVIYEVYSLVNLLFAYGNSDPELFNAHLGVRLSLGVVVLFCVFHSNQLRKSFNKAVNDRLRLDR